MPSSSFAGPFRTMVSGSVVTAPARQLSASVPMNSPRTGISLVACFSTVTVTCRSSQSEIETLSPTVSGKSTLQLSVCSPSEVTEETSSFRVMFFRLSFIRVFFRPESLRETWSRFCSVTISPRSARLSSPTTVTGISRTVPVPEGFSTLMTYIHTPTASTMARTILKILRFFFGLVTILLPFLSRTAGKVCAACRRRSPPGAAVHCAESVPASPGTSAGGGYR